jgi:hypothetical protein
LIPADSFKESDLKYIHRLSLNICDISGQKVWYKAYTEAKIVEYTVLNNLAAGGVILQVCSFCFTCSWILVKFNFSYTTEDNHLFMAAGLATFVFNINSDNSKKFPHGVEACMLLGLKRHFFHLKLSLIFFMLGLQSSHCQFQYLKQFFGILKL